MNFLISLLQNNQKRNFAYPSIGNQVVPYGQTDGWMDKYDKPSSHFSDVCDKLYIFHYMFYINIYAIYLHLFDLMGQCLAIKYRS